MTTWRICIAACIALACAGTAVAQVFPNRSLIRGALGERETARISAEFRGVWGSPRAACRGPGVLMRIEAETVGDLQVTRIRGFSDDASAIEVTLEVAAGLTQVQFIELSANGQALRVKAGLVESVFHRCTSLMVPYGLPVPARLEASGGGPWAPSDDGARGVAALIETGHSPGGARGLYSDFRGARPRFVIGCGGAFKGERYPRFALTFTRPDDILPDIAHALAQSSASVAAALSEPGRLILLDHERREIAGHIVYPSAEGLETGPLRYEHLMRLVNGPAHLRVETPRVAFEIPTAGLQTALAAQDNLTCEP
jgi:hypothetical protein